jgi:iron complex outermembrane receptor protein
VQGGASDSALRRAATASKIVVGREEIERFGDASVADVLKRLPGVTLGGRPGRGGEIRMRGMGGGYTQILVNGERMPPSFSLDQLPPDQIERIEVLRAPTAEYGARAVAGTINIVLREALARRLNELRLILGSERGDVKPQFSWTRNDKFGAVEGSAGHAYSLTVTGTDNKRRDDVDTRITTRDIGSGAESFQHNSGDSLDQRRSLNANGRLQLRLDGGSQLTLMPFAVVARGESDSRFRQTPGRNFDQADTRSESDFSMLRLNAMLMQRLDEDTRLELRGGLGRARMDNRSLRQEWLGLQPYREQQDDSRNRDQSLSLAGKFSRQLGQVEGVEHSLVAGLELERNQRQQHRSSLQNGLQRLELLDFGDEFDASTLRLAAYAQNEWNPSKQWSAYAGLRWEAIRTESKALNYGVSNTSKVLTPLLHAVWKPDEKSRDQVRMSLTRSYRAPNTQDLIARPTINAQYPDGANTANYADRAGNPDLKPETAIGIDVALERYLSKGGVLSASLFARRISELMRNVTRLESVSWSSEPRWVARPSNIGKALTTGIELEAKFRLDEFVEDAPPVSLRSNLSLFHSRVEDIPGPNNKLDQQPRYTANLGADYRLRSLPVSLGASLNLVPANTVQQSLLQESSNSRRRVFDAFALWNIDRDWALRLSASNLAPLDYANLSVLDTGEQLITTENAGRTFTSWQLRLEVKL